jgi:hypothetical protein
MLVRVGIRGVEGIVGNQSKNEAKRKINQSALGFGDGELKLNGTGD